MLFYQDFKDTFVCYTQRGYIDFRAIIRCFIRISKILLYAIHNSQYKTPDRLRVVLSGFQRYFCMLYTTQMVLVPITKMLFYQDFKDTFVCYTQQRISLFRKGRGCFIRISKILLYAIHNRQAKLLDLP